MRLDESDMISQAEAARIRGVSHEAIRNLVERGRLKAYRIGGRVFVSRREVEAFEPDPGGRPRKKSAKKGKGKKS